MKLQFLADGSPDCQLIRLYEFQVDEVGRLKDLFDSLANGSRTEISLHEQKDIEAVDGCKLDLRVSQRNAGIFQKERLTFECRLTEARWSDVASLVEPLCESARAHTYQWLNEDGQISLLLSPTGTW
jgi:hypothetical protein